jgi:colanic acid biosynthesis glycosyl transferase WcaI
VAAALHATRLGVPFGVLVQDLTTSATTQSGLPGGDKAAMPVRAVESWVLRRASRVAIISDAFRAPAERAGARAERIVTLPNWSHVTLPSRDRADVRRMLGWSDDTQVVLHAGNMGFKQCLDNVLETARLASQRRPSMHFVLMGDGSQRSRLRSVAHGMSNVEFLALQPADVFMDVLGAADVLLVNERATVRDMSLPSKLTSYFCAGRPVVAAVPPHGSTAHELARSEGAYLVPPEDPAALLDGVTAVASDGELAGRLVDRARAYVASHLDEQTALRHAEQFVEDLLAPAYAVP